MAWPFLQTSISTNNWWAAWNPWVWTISACWVNVSSNWSFNKSTLEAKVLCVAEWN
jgi:hypothetical protein